MGDVRGLELCFIEGRHRTGMSRSAQKAAPRGRIEKNRRPLEENKNTDRISQAIKPFQNRSSPDVTNLPKTTSTGTVIKQETQASIDAL
jgi:hypothetical protein